MDATIECRKGPEPIHHRLHSNKIGYPIPIRPYPLYMSEDTEEELIEAFKVFDRDRDGFSPCLSLLFYKFSILF